jgi:mannan endo-1,4-beta-mannosidase
MTADSVTVVIGGVTYTGTLAAQTPPVSYARPAGNTGSGLYVAGGRLNNPDATEARLRGVNRCHQDSNSAAGLIKAGVNAVRIFVSTIWDNQTPAGLASLVQTQHVANKQVPIVTAPYVSGTTASQVATSGDTSSADLATVAALWVSQAPSWLPVVNPCGIVNIANEWGPTDSVAWQSANIAAVATLRKAGYLCPLLIDAGGYGQDAAGLLAYAAGVLAADPQKNVLFGFHAYGGTTVANVSAQFASFSALAAQGVCVVISEFGPGENVGPSPTMVTPQQIITAAESNSLGWLPWAWDDNNEAGGATSPTGWFGMTLTGPGIYTQLSDLTAFGQLMVPYWGSLAKPLAVFG